MSNSLPLKLRIPNKLEPTISWLSSDAQTRCQCGDVNVNITGWNPFHPKNIKKRSPKGQKMAKGILIPELSFLHAKPSPTHLNSTSLSLRSIKARRPSMALCVPEAATALDKEHTPTRFPRRLLGEVGGEGSGTCRVRSCGENGDFNCFGEPQGTMKKVIES